MLLFRAEEDIQEWVTTTGESRGEFITLEKTWELSKHWYHNRASSEYRGRSIAEAAAIFNQLGLISNFWQFKV